MRCPFCGFLDTQVKDSRPSEDNSAIRRRRWCPECGSRFTTFERAQLCEIIVVKKRGDKVSFDREKLTRSIMTAVRKRHMSSEQIERVVSVVQRTIEASGTAEIPSSEIGALVMNGLKELDPVAYIRFASVYKDFSTAEDFQSLLESLKGGHVSIGSF